MRVVIALAMLAACTQTHEVSIRLEGSTALDQDCVKAMLLRVFDDNRVVILEHCLTGEDLTRALRDGDLSLPSFDLREGLQIELIALGCSGGDLLDCNLENDLIQIATATTELPANPPAELILQLDGIHPDGVCRPCGCGDNVARENEECDGDDLREVTCTSENELWVEGEPYCTDDCRLDYSNCQSGCGNNTVDTPDEDCDGTDLNGETCRSLSAGYGDGLRCTEYCAYDTDGCDLTGCGDEVRQAGEACDGTDFGGFSCIDFGFAPGGNLQCSENCDVIDTITCTGGPRAQCGNGFTDALEGCDNGSWPSGRMVPDCGHFDLAEGSGGPLGCTSSCTVDLSSCAPFPTGHRCETSDEICEPCDLLGFGIDPDCADVCTTAGSGCADYFDPRFGVWSCRRLGLVDPGCGNCPNGTAEGYDYWMGWAGEYCDGTDLHENWNGCHAFGYTGGTLTCGNACLPDLTACDAPVCGDNAVEGYEQCDLDNLSGDCETYGYSGGGVLACDDRCMLDYSGCIP